MYLFADLFLMRQLANGVSSPIDLMQIMMAINSRKRHFYKCFYKIVDNLNY